MSKAKRTVSGKVVLFTALMGGAAALAAGGAREAVAQAVPESNEQQAQAGATPVGFNIPAQPLAQALTQFGRQSGLQVAVDAAAVAGKSTGGVSGTMSSQSALQQLLAGTGVTFRFTSPSAVSVVAVAPGSSGALQLDPVQVQGNVVPQQAEIGRLAPPFAGGEVATGGRVGVLGERDYMNTPFSTTAYTQKYIQDNQALTLNEAVADDPTIRALYGQGSYDDGLMIRGFFLGANDMSFNGLYGLNPLNSINLLGIERIEVFRGPSALLSGMAPSGAIGGTINLVPKRATDAPITQATARYASAGQVGGQVDFGRRFGPDNALGLRINAGYSGGNTPVDGQSDSLLGVTVGFDFRSERTRLDADFGYQNRNVIAPQGGTDLMPGLRVPAAPNGTLNHYQPWGFYATNDTYGDLRFEHDILSNLTGYVKVGGRRSNGSSLLDFPTIMNASGATMSFPLRWLSFNESLSAEAGLRGRFETGFLKHEAVVSGSWLSISSGASIGVTPIVTSNIYAPVNQPVPNLPVPGNVPLTSQNVLSSISLIDAMSAWDERVQLIGGVRVQSVQTSNWSGVTGLPTPGYSQSAVTPSVSLVVRPWKEFALYGNFIQALEQGPTAGAGTLNAGQAFAPFVSTQFEVGAKLDLGNFGATLSAFQITRPSSFINPATNMLVVDGQQRNQGIEFTMFGEPVKGLRPIGGFTVLSPLLTSTLNGTNNGNYAPGVATFQANLGLDWDTPWVQGLTVGGRMIYTGNAYIDPANNFEVPAWTRFDVSAKYVFERADGKPIALRGQILNVGNNNFWIATNGYLTQGQPRTFMLSLTADF